MLGLLLAALFIVFNGFFVAAEFALVKMHAIHGRAGTTLKDERNAALVNILGRLDRYLSVTQVCITLASLGLGWVGEPAVEQLVHHAANALGAAALTETVLHVVTTIVAFTLLTFSHVLLGELIPKLIAIQRSERVALLSTGPLRLMLLVFRPLLWVLEHASRLALRIMGMSPDAASEGTLSEDEILGILAATTTRSPKGREKAELLERVIRFSERTARHAMVPRVDVASLPLRTSVKEAVLYLRAQQYSRILLTKERSLDEVAGYLYTKDVLLDEATLTQTNLARLRRDVLFVPETMTLLDVLRAMQSEQTPIAVVVDEYGGTSGIVTMEDLLEEIVGEIRDELDVEAPRVIPVKEEPDTWDVDGRAQMDELRRVGIDIDDEIAGEPIGAVVLERIGRLPRRGDRVEIAPHTFAVVTTISRRRITRVRVRRERPAEEA